MSEKNQNIQDVFLNKIRKDKMTVTVFLVNGVKLQGIVTWFDNFSMLLRRDSAVQLVYKHAISTIMPAGPMSFYDGEDTHAPYDGGDQSPVDPA
jgi:host factor-I protein